MTATAESIVAELRKLPPAELCKVCRAAIELVARAGASAAPPTGAESVEIGDADDDANEAAFFKALEELRQRGTLNLQASRVGD